MKKLPVLARLKEHAADIASVQSSVSYVVEGNMSSTAIPAGKFFQLVHSTVSGRSDGAYTASKAITANTAIDASYFNESSPIAGGITNSIQSGGGGTGTVTGASLGSVSITPDSSGILNFPVDASPTEDSNSLLTSGRIYTEIEQINDRIDNLDPELPSTVFSDVNFSIATNDWILNIDTGLYNASVTNTTLLTATSGVQIFYDSSYRTALTGDIYITKYTGYVTFTTDSQPTGTLTGFMRIIDSVSGIVPVSRGGTGAATPRQARENLNAPIRDIFVDFGTVSSLPQTVYDADLRANMVAFDAVFSNPGAVPGGIQATFADPSGNLGGSVTITGTISGSTTISFFAHEKRTSVEGSETTSDTQRVQDFVQTNAQTLTAAQKAQVLDNIGGASEEDVTELSNSLAQTTKWKTVTLGSDVIGTSFSTTSRNIGSTSSLFGISSGQKIVSILVREASLTPASCFVPGIFNNNVFLATTQSCTLSSSAVFEICYHD